MRLTKIIPKRIIPEHQKTIEFNWCHKDWMIMTPRYRAIRSGLSDMNSCKWCRHKFIDGEKFSLAQPKGKPNWTLCSKCADELLSSEEE